MGSILYKEVFINASIEDVFDSFTKPQAMLLWHGKEVDLNPTPGGIYKVVFENGTTIVGSYKEVEINKKVVYTARYGSVESLITVNFIRENGGTRIKLTQEFDMGQDTSSFDGGWDYFLGILREAMTS